VVRCTCLFSVIFLFFFFSLNFFIHVGLHELGVSVESDLIAQTCTITHYQSLMKNLLPATYCF
jgi:hypothetical protein